MMHATVWMMVLMLAASAGCGGRAGGPPEIHLDRTACAHCGMLVSEAVYAAAYRTPAGEARVFDDVGCLIAAARAHAEREALVFWFQDGNAGGWLAAGEAVFVRSSSLPTPMGGGVLAFGSKDAARRAALEHQGEVVTSFADLLSRKEGDL